MRSCLVLGSGRSGTSLLAGILSGAGYYMGEAPVESTVANPRGFFEDYAINWINEELLRPVTPLWFEYGWRWLAAVPVGLPALRDPAPPSIAERVMEQTSREPFCFKDPRFCYTLPFWRPFIENAALLCVFRDPARTASSMVKESRTASYLQGFDLTIDAALDVWTRMYQHIVDVHRHRGDWLFVHYDQLLDGSGLPQIEALVGAPASRSFADAGLSRTPSSDQNVSEVTRRMYAELCRLAQFEPRDLST